MDVNIDSPGPVSGDVLTYDANSPGGWIAAPLPLDIDHDAITLQGGSPSLDYLTLNNQEISLGLINLATDVTGILDAAQCF